MALKVTTIDVFAAIKAKWSGTASLVADWSGGIWTDVQEKTPRPYVFLAPTGEGPSIRTNKTQFGDVEFDMELVVDVFEDFSGRVDRLIEAFVKVPMTLAKNNARILLVPDPRVQFVQESNYWRAVVTFVAKLAQDRTDK